MSNPSQIFYGDGQTKVFHFAFPYIHRDHINVYVDGKITTATIKGNRISLEKTPGQNVKILVERFTPRDLELIRFKNGATLTEKDLQNFLLRSLFILQEMADNLDQKLTASKTGEWLGENKKIKNISEGTEESDVVNLKQLRSIEKKITGILDNLQASNKVNEEKMITLQKDTTKEFEAVDKVINFLKDILRCNQEENKKNHLKELKNRVKIQAELDRLSDMSAREIASTEIAINECRAYLEHLNQKIDALTVCKPKYVDLNFHLGSITADKNIKKQSSSLRVKEKVYAFTIEVQMEIPWQIRKGIQLEIGCAQTGENKRVQNIFLPKYPSDKIAEKFIIPWEAGKPSRIELECKLSGNNILKEAVKIHTKIVGAFFYEEKNQT